LIFFFLSSKSVHADPVLVSLSEDLKDGLVLHRLLEALSRRTFGTMKNPAKTTFDCLGNLNACMAFLVNEERVKLVNIGATDLHEGNQKLALGLLWSLILHYQIGHVKSRPASSSFGATSPVAAVTPPAATSYSLRTSAPQVSDESSAKRVLMDWCSAKLGEPLPNFGKCFKDGRVFAKLLNSIDPRCVDESKLTADACANLELCFNSAFEKLALPKLLDATEIAYLDPDPLSLMTYIAIMRQKEIESARPPPPTLPTKSDAVSRAVPVVVDKATSAPVPPRERSASSVASDAQITELRTEMARLRQQVDAAKAELIEERQLADAAIVEAENAAAEELASSVEAARVAERAALDSRLAALRDELAAAERQRAADAERVVAQERDAERAAARQQLDKALADARRLAADLEARESELARLNRDAELARAAVAATGDSARAQLDALAAEHQRAAAERAAAHDSALAALTATLADRDAALATPARAQQSSRPILYNRPTRCASRSPTSALRATVTPPSRARSKRRTTRCWRRENRTNPVQWLCVHSSTLVRGHTMKRRARSKRRRRSTRRRAIALRNC
jgi:hypothetical protein